MFTVPERRLPSIQDYLLHSEETVPSEARQQAFGAGTPKTLGNKDIECNLYCCRLTSYSALLTWLQRSLQPHLSSMPTDLLVSNHLCCLTASDWLNTPESGDQQWVLRTRVGNGCSNCRRTVSDFVQNIPGWLLTYHLSVNLDFLCENI